MLNQNGEGGLSLRGGDTSHGRLTPRPTKLSAERDFYEVPPADFYATRGAQDRQHQQEFDFNNPQIPNPFGRPEPKPRRHGEPAREGSSIETRHFYNCRDDKELRTYLNTRSISVGFLKEIDQFFIGHPEIATCAEGRSTLQQLSVLPPLDAYKYFLKGYTRPARYVDGVIRTDDFTVPPDFSYQALSSKTDPELIDFFDGFQYRHDIIERIDSEVYMGMKDLVQGRHIPVALRKLICYAVWGNPVDAYKWFEYLYQTEYMPHRYLPEHVVLGHIPKPTNHADPRPSVLSGPLRHREVRSRMARANDQGVDVLEVLIAEYRIALIRRAHRRVEIDALVATAKQRLETERQDPTGVDIVDFIMDDAVTRRGTNRRVGLRSQNPRARRTYNPGDYSITFNGSVFNGGTHTFTRANARRAPGSIHTQATELRNARATLLRLYAQEQNVISSGGIDARQSTLQMIRASRATAERRYVNCLIRYCRDSNRMTAWQATQLQSDFTRQKMTNLGVYNGNYLLGLFPRELY
ncbi:hypothetical protein DE146DRAFT_784606 [Phaeosphaeria sp. MPI-PUGE-AT-0046c]|nr:hypothetical protein DE146DRAFT_784606 [Phaeosphaeria sp. MPI-PUGE-AT-0046c]